MIMGNRKDLTNWQSNWRPSNGAAFFLLAVAFLSQLGRLTAQQQQPRVEQSDEQQRQLQQQTFSGERSAGNDRRAFAAPLDKRQQQGNSVLLNGEPKPFFKIHYRDGVQKAIFDETPRRVPPDFEDNNVGRGREFDAYEDDRLVDPRNEAQLWIPFIYRNESEEVVESTPAPLRTTRPLVAPEVLQSRQPVIVRTTTQQSPFGRPPQPAIRPAQPFGRPPPPAPGQPPFQPRPPPQPQFPPQQQQRPPPQQGFLPQQFRPAIPQQPFSNQQPFQPQPPPPPPQLTRPQQPPPPPPVAPPQQPQQSFSNAANIRTGVCRNTIFYTPQPVTAFDVQRIYTHFAMVVSVDQCARTCHEFNCDVAILDPRTRHCQFNPSTAFRLVPSCPRWPNPLFRNNFQLGEELVKIQCVTCQQRRRGNRPAGAQQLPANLPPAGLGQQQQSFNLRRPSQPQFVLRTTTRERIGNADLNGNGLNASPIQRVANAAKTKKFAADGSTAFSTDEEPAPRVQAERDLSEEFHKLERLLKSAEDYLDQPGGSGQKGRGLKSGREVPSWREGHPQGDGFSPLKINPLRQPYFSDHIRPTPIFYSTDSLRQRRPEDEDISPSVSKRRSQRQTTDGLSSAESSPPEADSSAIPAAGGAKPKLNSAGSVKLQTQQPDGLRELPEEKAK